MRDARSTLVIMAVVSLIVSFAIAVVIGATADTQTGISGTGLSIANWAEQVTLFLGIVATAGALATWIMDKHAEKRGSL